MTTRTLTATGGASVAKALVVPLTTVWSLPPDCRNYIYEGFRLISTSCVPPQFNSVWYEGGYYSPGVCPSSYTIGCTVTNVESWTDLAAGPSGIAGETIAPGESAYYCVPSNFKCHDLLYATTVSAVGSSTATPTDDPLPYYLPALQIRWHPTDLAVLQTTLATSLPSSESSPTAAQSTDGPNGSTGNGSSSGDSVGLSKGAIAGICVAAALVVVSAVGLLLFFGLRRRRQRTLEPKQAIRPSSTAPHLGGEPTPELAGNEVFQADNSEVYKVNLHQQSEIAELPGQIYPDLDKGGEDRI